MRVYLKTSSERLTYWRTLLSGWRQKVHCISGEENLIQDNGQVPSDIIVLIDAYGLNEFTLNRELRFYSYCYSVVVDYEGKWAGYLIRESENFKVSDYMCDGISEKCLSELVHRCFTRKFKQHINHSEKVYITIWNNGEKFFINSKDIYMLEGFGAYTRIHSKDQEYIVSKTLKNLLLTLPNCFIRTHRSFAVHLGHINSMKGDYVMLQNGQSARASKQGKKNLFVRLENEKYAIAQ